MTGNDALSREPGAWHVVAPVRQLLRLLARDLSGWVRTCVDCGGVAHLALSGGNTPKAFFELLAGDPEFRDIPWPRIHLWQVDERKVTPDDERSNWRMIRRCLVDPIGFPARLQHPMPVLEEDGDVRYERELRASLRGGLDWVLLGLGDDGHTASLFPCSSALEEAERWVVWNDGERVPAPKPRLTMTYPILNQARRRSVLVTGRGKREILETLRAATPDRNRLPVTGIGPKDLTWYVDTEAAGLP